MTIARLEALFAVGLVPVPVGGGLLGVDGVAVDESIALEPAPLAMAKRYLLVSTSRGAATRFCKMRQRTMLAERVTA